MKSRSFLLLVICLVMLVLNNAHGSMWYDGFDDETVDMTNYQIHLGGSGGSVTVDEPVDFDYASVQTNSPGGEYVLTAVKVEPGDTVRTMFQQVSAWDYWGSRSAIGLMYDLSASDAALYNGVCMFMHQRFDDVRVYRSASDSLGESQIIMTDVGDPEGQKWIYEMVLGTENVDGSVDIAFSIYDESGVQLGSSVTMTAKSPTGDMYWYTGNTKTLDYVYELSIVPEPATICILASGAFLTILKRKKHVFK